MQFHTISTGTVRITQNWRVGKGANNMRLLHTLLDTRFTDWLPINVFVIEHPEGLLVVDTGIPADANRPILFPPFMPLVQRAARFDITPEQEIGPQMRKLGLEPEDVRYVVLTHLHQDHEGGLHHFPNAEFIVSRAEWDAAQGFAGRMAGYLNYRWPEWFHPTLIDFEDGPLGTFDAHQHLLDGVYLVPTPGHSAGHLSVIVEDSDETLFFAGDAAYAQELLLADSVDGVGPDVAAQHDTHRRIMQFAAQQPTIFLPSHDPDAAARLRERVPIPVEDIVMA